MLIFYKPGQGYVSKQGLWTYTKSQESKDVIFYLHHLLPYNMLSEHGEIALFVLLLYVFNFSKFSRNMLQDNKLRDDSQPALGTQ